MKYLEKARLNLRTVLTEFIENEPEEYTKLLELYNMSIKKLENNK
jgi:hypothetical protein